MIAGTGKQRWVPYRMLMSGIMMFLVICLFLFSGCGTVPPDQPLTSGTDTATDQGSPGSLTASVGSQVAPIKVIDAQTNVTTYPGGYMTLTISTSPFAVCNFAVSYGLSTPSKAGGITPRTADANGIASWRWQVEPGAHTGTWPLTLSAVLASGAQRSATVSVNVTLAPISVVSNQSNLTGSPTGNMALTIATAPSVDCTLLLNFGPGILNRTLSKKAGSNGIVSWSWRVDKDANAGVWPLTITVILLDGEKSSAQVKMTVL